MDLQLGNPHYIWLLAIVAMGLVLTGIATVARRRAALIFATENLGKRLMPVSTRARHWVSALLVASSLALLSIAMMDIRWGKTWREVPQKGIEVMFVLDVSRSMLAEDATPNRLSRAKQQILDMVDEMAGDRIGLLVFAGDNRQVVPLTSHYEDFKQTLDSAGPHSVRRGGSRLGDAIEAAAHGFISKTNDHKAIVIFTDGEDQESRPVEIAKQLHDDKGIRIFTVGLGDMDRGARIPDSESRRGTFVEHEGQQVWSKMNGQILSQIATETNGAYIPAGTKRVNMSDVYHGYICDVAATEFETAKINAYVARYQWFAAPALALLLLEVFLSTRSSRVGQRSVGRGAQAMRTHHASNGESARIPHSASIGGSARLSPLDPPDKPSPLDPSTKHKSIKNAFVLMLLVLTLSASAHGQSTLPDVASRINTANSLVRQGKIEEAISEYLQVQPDPAAQNKLNYNLAVAQYRNGDIAAAENLFAESAASTDAALAARSRYNLGNCLYTKALQVAKQDKPSAIEQLRDAISHYRGSLSEDASNADARANIELANQLIRKLQDEQEQEQQQQQTQNQQTNDPQQKQDQQDQQDQSGGQEAQQNNQEPSDQQQDSQGNESKQNESQDNTKSQNQSDDQQDKSDQTGGENTTPDGEQQQPQPSPSTDNPPQNEQADSSASQPEPDGEQPNSEQQSQSPTPATGDKPTQKEPVTQAGQQHSGDQQSSDDGSGEGKLDDENQSIPTGELTAAEDQDQNGEVVESEPDSKGNPGLMTKEEALKMLQAVRDRDMLRRLRLQQLERSRSIPVERDW